MKYRRAILAACCEISTEYSGLENVNSLKLMKPRLFRQSVGLCVAMMALLFTIQVRAQVARQIAQNTFPSVVLLVMEDANGQPISLGSGFFVRTNVSESDKGCVLIIASILEETLRQLHEAHIAVITYPSKKNVFKDLSNAQLSTFAGLVQIANAYGLISDEDYKDLQLIRKLRNEAAHCIFDFSLQDSGVKAIVMQLSADERAGRKVGDLEKKSSDARPVLNLPKLTEVRSHLILNGLALHDIIVAKLADAIERLLARRKTVST